MKNFLSTLCGASIGVVLVLSALFVMSKHESRYLPKPPDFTAAEMSLRACDFVSHHVSVCEACKSRYRTELVPLPCAEKAYADAMVVGNWVAIGCGPGVSGKMLWSYVGRPVPGWRWSKLSQCWRSTR